MFRSKKAMPVGPLRPSFSEASRQGFTLIELLIVIAIIAIIAAVVFVSLDPLTRFQDARDARRWSDITAVLGAIRVDQIDNGGAYASAISGLTVDIYYVIGTAGGGCDTTCGAQTTQAACADLISGADDLVTEGYLASIPFDPSNGSAVNTDYYIMRATNGLVTIGACDPEGGSAISVAR